jgi:SAM-dependent methyltransferase
MAALSFSPALDAYEPFADVYDLFTAHHEYDAWIASLERVAERHGLGGRRLLDIACGTGKSLVPWLDRGYTAAGCDLSPRMLARAKQTVRGRARLFRADMRALPTGEPVDLVTCLDDAVNYVLDPGELRQAFACAAKQLAPSGVYVFDLNSLRAYREEFGSTLSSTTGGWEFTWRGHGRGDPRAGGMRSATISARLVGEPTRAQIVSTHVQRHHPVPLVAEALSSVGMRDVAVYGQHRDGALDAQFDELVHAKALVVARKTWLRR